MDFQRNLLLIAFLATGYLLFLAWQEDYGHKPPVTATVAAQPAATAVAAASGDLPSPAPQTAPVGGDDLAGLAPSSAQTGAVNDMPASVSSGTRVNVRTDVFDLDIDLNGGDIVSLDLLAFPRSLEEKGSAFTLLDDRGTTYIASSGLVSEAGPDTASARALWQAAQQQYTLADGSDVLEVVLTHDNGAGLQTEKRYTFRRGDYLVQVDYRVRNNGSAPWTGFMFGQLKRDGAKDPSQVDNGFMSAMPTYLGAAYSSPEQKYNKATFDDMMEAPVKVDMQGGWIAFVQHYFVSAWIPPADVAGSFTTRYRPDTGHFLMSFTSPQVSIAPGGEGSTSASFYAGPKDQDRLAGIANGLDLTVDYGWFWFIAQPLFALLVFFHDLVGNWGIAIILLTVLVKLVFFWPSQISYRSMANMRRITPELTRIREEFKNDKQKQSMEMMALYRREKINPLGGCLPILLQMPVFISLYFVLLESVELRQATFYGWLHDLSVMDPYFILPILMGASMWVQMKLNPAPPDPMQAKIMGYLPWIFTVFFLFFPAGLVLYWLVNNVLSIAQQWVITRQIEKQHAARA
jgi:YidC/Oxa1 family membrane protein insertase